MINDKKGKNSTAHSRKDAGVSEIIGDILILGITVVLFTSIFFYVDAMPTPTAQTYADFQASVVNGSLNGAPTSILSITHLGGQNLKAGTTTIVVQVNQTTYVFAMNQGYSAINQNGPSPQWINGSWQTNQAWIEGVSGVTSSSIISVSIINTASNYVVWSVVLFARSSMLGPIIQSGWVSPNPISPGKNITVYANVIGDRSGLYVNASLNFVNPSLGTVSMVFNQSSGYYQTPILPTSKQLNIGQDYPILINMTSAGRQAGNFTISLAVARLGPLIVTASINPNPNTPGSNFSVTAYVTDTNTTAFNPPLAGQVTIQAYSNTSLTNITGPSNMTIGLYPGIMTFKGHVLSNATGFETFKLKATDSFGYTSTYYVVLVVISTLNSGSSNTSYPAPYLGPTSMSFSGFTWNQPEQQGQSSSQISYNNAYSINAQYVSGKNPSGLYFNLILQNHNTTNDLYLDDLSDMYMFMLTQVKPGENIASPQMAFIDLNTTQNSRVWTVGSSSSTSSPSYDSVAPPGGQSYQSLNGQNELWYPSLGWPLGNSQPWNTQFVLLPAAVGGVVVSTKVSFGASYGGVGGGTKSIPLTSGGPFVLTAADNFQTPSLSINFLLLFGYQIPAGEQPTSSIIQSGTPYGQTLPFTAIYWYNYQNGG